MSSKTLPYNNEAEMAVLGSIILNPDALYTVMQIINGDDFYMEQNRTVYRAIQTLNNRDQRPDPITLDVELRVLKPQVIWIDYINTLIQYTPDEASASHYAEIVAEKATRRRMIQAAKEISELAYNEEEELTAQLSKAENTFFNLRGKDIVGAEVDPADYCNTYFSQFEERLGSEEEFFGIPTGYYDLDQTLNGLQKTHHVFAGRPGMGKSIAAVDIGDYASSLGFKVGLFSIEMDHEKIMNRRIAKLTGISTNKIERPNKLSQHELRAVREARPVLAERPFYIDCSGDLTLSELCAKAFILHKKYNLDLLMVDHLHEMKLETNYTRQDLNIAHNIRGLTRLYNSLELPGITFSQLSRSLESRQDKRPVLSDLRETGAIEETAAIVVFIHREIVHRPEQTERANIAEFIIGKNRGGPLRTIELFFHAEVASFRNLTRQPKTTNKPRSNGHHPQEALEIF